MPQEQRLLNGDLVLAFKESLWREKWISHADPTVRTNLIRSTDNGVTWHSNPWTYFKTNLIEYELNPFFDKLNLTTSDNETIKKYVKFLSPTYLFTWININLRPWIEDVNLIIDSGEEFLMTITKTLGDPRPTPSPWPVHPPGIGGVPDHTPGDPWIQKTPVRCHPSIYNTWGKRRSQGGPNPPT